MGEWTWRRYKISAELVAQTPLHIGSGREMSLKIDEDSGQETRLEDEEEKIKVVKVQGVAKDAAGRPYLPGSTLKGCLRELAEKWRLSKEIRDQLLGCPPPEREGATPGQEDKDPGWGGRLVFAAAFLKEASPTPPLFQSENPPLWWDGERFTYVMAGVALDRVTRTARRHKLFHYEVVPKGSRFWMEICTDGPSDRELGTFLAFLEAIRKSSLVLGGHWAQGFGRLHLGEIKVHGIRTEEEARQWLAGPAAGFEGLPELSPETLEALPAGEWVRPDEVSEKLELEVVLQFEGPFLINDPTRPTRSAGEGEGAAHHYLESTDGAILLSSSSFRGALRSQAERIARTMAPAGARRNGGATSSRRLRPPCYIDDPQLACKPVTRMTAVPEREGEEKKEEEGTRDAVENLCLTCRLFGASGWRSPLEIPDFFPLEEGEELEQELVAIDRFTGGAAPGKKFNARYRFKPCLKGRIGIDLARIDAGHAGLLVLGMRDLIEGDIQFGLGRGKGFGACTARITAVGLPDKWPVWLERGWIPEDVSELSDLSRFRTAQQMALGCLVECLQEGFQ
ncbi:MAG: RAMP superfamily CRISPR-associated protein [Acidobacteriota bacterium]